MGRHLPQPLYFLKKEKESSAYFQKARITKKNWAFVISIISGIDE